VVILAVARTVASAALVVGAEPSATPAVLVGGDPRSDGGGPGLSGSPLVVLAGVVGIGIATALLTALLARAGRRG
jgi:hypothetical protein